ncbi:methyl-accepting chemotaxis protein [Zavarzinia sp. CC-PAN008]|uniref:methyl-accepting chemotaxis protein n=1 Tax=Zavarzinia sp. CC-PAN008 TaxID=3243332 RepID=UPI003F743A5E
MALVATRRMSIGRAVLIGAVATALLPALVLGVGLTMEARALMVRELLERNLTAARGLAGYLDMTVTDHRQALAVLASRIARMPPDNAFAIDQELDDVHDAFPLFARVSLTNAAGVVVQAAPEVIDNSPTVIGVDLSDRSFIRAAVETRRAVVDHEVVISRTTGQAQFVIAAPVISADGVLRGVLTGAISLTNTKTVVDAQDFGRTGRTTVATQTGTPIAQDDRDPSLAGINYSRLSIWPSLTAADRGEIASYRDHAGEERLASFATVDATGWKVWSSVTMAEVDEMIADTYRSILLWVLGAIGLALVMAILFGRAVARPLRALEATAFRLADGQLDERAAEDGFQELARVAQALNVLAGNLQKTLEDERTARQALSSGVSDYSALAERVAAGDLSVRVNAEGRGDLGRLGLALNTMTESLGRLVSEIQGAVSRLASASAEILASTSQQVSATAEEASAVRQTAATVFEVRRTAETAARSTRHVTELAQRAESIVATGRQSVSESIAGSVDAKERMETLAERILALSEQTQAIAEINAVVGELAEKSNLLAVNAGIEAAKAGEAGRGFSVVAMEVKDLANRSKEATSQVRRILLAIQKSAQAAVMAAEQGVKVAGGGANLARQSGDAIAALADSVIQASQAAQQISASASQQEAGMEQISLAMRNIEQSSAQTAAATKQVEQTARDLDTLAQTLSELVRNMLTDRAGRRG